MFEVLWDPQLERANALQNDKDRKLVMSLKNEKMNKTHSLRINRLRKHPQLQDKLLHLHETAERPYPPEKEAFLKIVNQSKG